MQKPILLTVLAARNPSQDIGWTARPGAENGTENTIVCVHDIDTIVLYAGSREAYPDAESLVIMRDGWEYAVADNFSGLFNRI